jgi:hypothetical protein
MGVQDDGGLAQMVIARHRRTRLVEEGARMQEECECTLRDRNGNNRKVLAMGTE